MVTSDVAGSRPGAGSIEATIRKIRATIARMSRASAGPNRDLDALMRSCDALAEEIEDLLARQAYLGTRDQPTVPDAVLARLLSGASPLRAWREYRGLTLRRLATMTGVAASTLSEIETGVTEGSLRTLRRLAAALDVAIDDLLPVAGD